MRKDVLIVARDWIGLHVEVVDSPNRCEIGLSGEVWDETQKTLRLRTEKGLKTVAKKGRTFKIKFGGKIMRISGDLIAFRPEDRIKRGLILIERAKGL